MRHSALALDRTPVPAPFDGRVKRDMADIGQTVTPLQPIATLFSTGSAEIEVGIPVDELLWLEEGNKEIGPWKYALVFLTIALSFLMVSNVEYPSFKSVNWRTRRSFQWVIVFILVAWFAVKNWQCTPAVFFVSYLAYGLFRPWISRKWQREIEIESDPADDLPTDAAAPTEPTDDSAEAAKI